MFFTAGLILAQASSQSGVTHLVCDEYASGRPNGIVWSVTLNETQGFVDYRILQPETRAVTRRPATFSATAVEWRTSDRGHPLTGVIAEMGVSRIHLKLVLQDVDFVTGKIKGFRNSQCRIATIPERAF